MSRGHSEWPRPIDRRSTGRALTTGVVGVNISEDVRQYAAEQGIAEEEVLKKGMEEKSKEFVEHGAEVYTKA